MEEGVDPSSQTGSPRGAPSDGRRQRDDDDGDAGNFHLQGAAGGGAVGRQGSSRLSAAAYNERLSISMINDLTGDGNNRLSSSSGGRRRSAEMRAADITSDEESYEDEHETQAIVENHYRMMRTNQTLAFVRRMHEKYCHFNHGKMSILEAMQKLDDFVDASDPDIDLSTLDHALQTAEGPSVFLALTHPPLLLCVSPSLPLALSLSLALPHSHSLALSLSRRR